MVISSLEPGQQYQFQVWATHEGKDAVWVGDPSGGPSTYGDPNPTDAPNPYHRISDSVSGTFTTPYPNLTSPTNIVSNPAQSVDANFTVSFDAPTGGSGDYAISVTADDSNNYLKDDTVTAVKDTTDDKYTATFHLNRVQLSGKLSLSFTVTATDNSAKDPSGNPYTANVSATLPVYSPA